jgi:hypothetical protein
MNGQWDEYDRVEGFYLTKADVPTSEFRVIRLFVFTLLWLGLAQRHDR